ncbi:MAG: EAL domain-containing protein, partial [Saprospiraceae bacterium]|nr:EAL domain-containing protein [Saprospiraceae bacterium]
VTASAGVAVFPFHGTDVPGLLSNVDTAMFQAKESGRNRYVLFGSDPDEKRNTQRRVHWSRKLREAIDADRIVLHCQPVVRLADRKTMHYEVLARLRDDDGSLIQPAQFLKNGHLLKQFRIKGKLDVFFQQWQTCLVNMPRFQGQLRGIFAVPHRFNAQKKDAVLKIPLDLINDVADVDIAACNDGAVVNDVFLRWVLVGHLFWLMVFYFFISNLNPIFTI